MHTALAAKKIVNAAELQSYLLDKYGIAVLGGHHFGDDPNGLRLRAATSQLYGSRTDEQWAALRSPQPTLLPHIADQLQVLRNALEELTDETDGARSRSCGCVGLSTAIRAVRRVP